VRERTSIAERARGGADRWMAMIERKPESQLLFMEFWGYAARDPEVRLQVAASFARARAVLTGLIAEGARDFELELELPVEQLAIAIDALADGIAHLKMADPDAVPDELMGRVLALLLAGATRPARTGTRSAP
jgi:hypothetical protein